MNDTAFRAAPIILDRRLTLGDTEYQVTSFPAENDRFDLCIVSSDTDGNVVSEVSAGIAPADLPGLTDVLTSTLAGLLAMTQPSAPARDAPPPDRRHPNQGARWTPDDDDRLLTRYREGARPRDLMKEFGRSNGGIRARLEYLGELAPGARWHSPTTPPTPSSDSTTIPTTQAGAPAPAASTPPSSPTMSTESGVSTPAASAPPSHTTAGPHADDPTSVASAPPSRTTPISTAPGADASTGEAAM
ncbi:hypothetical protein [Paractinoplanes atraurantiacus]|uniref:Uncharacterized protein n=1 Tax=Paractinoplanes atraurantiacus TaxID=1036182 RepID=A0A285HEE3_9ACTN|nr:hypothetical protein [Actinoplanes atraurantiacus]SNY34014.1 hypothetical protein SAMN05421748_104217 [Actinoplanes atraurantiacus]